MNTMIPSSYIDDFQARVDEQDKLIQSLRSENEEISRRYYRLLEELRLARYHRFGSSSEASAYQGELFDVEEELESEPEECQPGDADSSSPRKRQPKRQRLPKHLPRTVIRHEPDDTHCNECGHELHCMGEDISEKLVFIPARVEVEQHVRPKCVCRHCEKHSNDITIHQAPMPATVFPKGIATPSLVAHIIAMKFQYGLPLTRIAALLSDWGVSVSRRTMADWVMQASNALKPVWEHLKVELLKENALHADETPVKVIGSYKKKTYMWVYCSGADSPNTEHVIPDYAPKPIVLYDHQMGRSGRYAKTFLDGYKGYLHTDGYQGYEKIDATLVGCWAHARRKFIEAKKVQGNDEGGVRVALHHIKTLYKIEHEIKSNTINERYLRRQSDSEEELNTFKRWLDKTILRIPKQSALGNAVSYTLSQWPKLIRYIDDGRLNIDNNRAERAIRPFVVGRNAWLFNKSERGARSSCILYSLVETAKANGLVPVEYLTICLEKLALPTLSLFSLEPWKIK